MNTRQKQPEEGGLPTNRARATESEEDNSSGRIGWLQLGYATLLDPCMKIHLVPIIGTGTMARVRLCQHKSTGKFYCMKIVNKARMLALKQVEHIHNEKSVQHEKLTGAFPFTDDQIFQKTVSDDEISFPPDFDPMGSPAKVKEHPWFGTVDWADVLAKRNRGPLNPGVEIEGDTNHFYVQGDNADPPIVIPDVELVALNTMFKTF
ncbi:hypothetical protein PROFUN_05674 [Planoprotostelium fungivorum]|uniref:AGC-kinase C-terminal domain-containing protein n=1 Tax=Planoprotostelium fungivorum TaxID=1890364 RepID=A0A2P6MUI8_9EUKA|nr:hypothetical protein PROFUN_05674 [Planoprotostelium fungivorum]